MSSVDHPQYPSSSADSQSKGGGSSSSSSRAQALMEVHKTLQMKAEQLPTPPTPQMMMMLGNPQAAMMAAAAAATRTSIPGGRAPPRPTINSRWTSASATDDLLPNNREPYLFSIYGTGRSRL